MNKVLSALVIICLVAAAVRLYPAAVSGLPFSVDAWPLIRNTELLLQNTPTPITGVMFDGYNNYWPGCQLFGAVLSQVTSLPVADALALGIPFAAALAVPIFFVLSRKVTQNTAVAAVAALLLATAFPYALFTAGVTKETYASPILFTVILVFLLKPGWKTIFLFGLASFALVFSHHFTAFLAVVVLWGLCIALAASKKSYSPTPAAQPHLVYAMVLSGLAVLYMVLFAYPGMNIALTASDLLSVGAYTTLLVALAIYAVYSAKGHRMRKTVLLCTGGFASQALIMIIITHTSLSPGAPILPMHYFLYAVPFLLGVPLIIFGFQNLHQRRSSLLLPFFWVVMIAAFTCYAVFSNIPDGFGLAYRSMNFILPPFVLLAAIGIAGLVSNGQSNSRRILGAVAVGVCLCMVSVGVYSGYASVVLEEPYFGYFWRYQPQEYQASAWMATRVGNQTVAGDYKVYYLLDEYFGRNVSVGAGLEYLAGDGGAPDSIYVYRQMYRNGYVFGSGTPVALPQNWAGKLSDYNQVYVNSEVTVYANP
jgi:hypothetical protein